MNKSKNLYNTVHKEYIKNNITLRNYDLSSKLLYKENIPKKDKKDNITLEKFNLLSELLDNKSISEEHIKSNITLKNFNSSSKPLKVISKEYVEKSTIEHKYDVHIATINEDKFKKLYEKYSKIIFNFTRNDIIEDGIYSESEKFVLKLMKKNKYLTINILSFTISRYFNDDKLLISILNIISGFSSDILERDPCFKSLVISCLSNKNIFVKECALKFFENSGTINDITVLENTDIKETWLNKYREKIISYLRGQ